MGEATVPAEQPAPGQAAWLPAPDVDQGRPRHSPRSAGQRPGQTVGLIWRVRGRAEFDQFRRGQRGRSGPVTVTFVPEAGLVPKVAYAIGRKVGPAVVRNRLRRQLRSVMASLDLSPGRYLVSPNPAATELVFDELRAALAEAAHAAAGNR